MKKLIVVLIIILSTMIVSAQTFSGFGAGVSVNRLNDRDLSVTTLDINYAFNNFYVEVGGSQFTKNDKPAFMKFNVGYAFNIQETDFLVPYFGMSYETDIDPKLNLGVYIISHLSEKIYLMGGVGTTEKIKVGIGFVFGGSFCTGGSCLAK